MGKRVKDKTSRRSVGEEWFSDDPHGGVIERKARQLREKTAPSEREAWDAIYKDDHGGLINLGPRPAPSGPPVAFALLGFAGIGFLAALASGRLQLAGLSLIGIGLFFATFAIYSHRNPCWWEGPWWRDHPRVAGYFGGPVSIAGLPQAVGERRVRVAQVAVATTLIVIGVALL